MNILYNFINRKITFIQGVHKMRTIYTNGNFYTFDLGKPAVQAVVIENGRFIDMGPSDEMLLHWGRTDSKIIDLEGKTVTPGLTDSHLHLSGVGANFLDL